MKIVIDTNVWISFLIGHRKQLVRQLLVDEQIDIYVSSALISEICDVAKRDKIRKHISPADLEELLAIIQASCHFVTVDHQAKSNIRDSKDLFLLSLAETIEADYIISGDKDLTDLHSHAGIPILKYSEFLDRLNTKP